MAEIPPRAWPTPRSSNSAAKKYVIVIGPQSSERLVYVQRPASGPTRPLPGRALSAFPLRLSDNRCCTARLERSSWTKDGFWLHRDRARVGQLFLFARRSSASMSRMLSRGPGLTGPSLLWRDHPGSAAALH